MGARWVGDTLCRSLRFATMMPPARELVGYASCCDLEQLSQQVAVTVYRPSLGMKHAWGAR